MWSLAGVLPLLLVMPIWSAYYYLFALFGAALLIAGLTKSLPTAQRSLIVGGLVLLFTQARALDEFSPARGAWAWQSHVNRHYIERATTLIESYLREMRRARPTLPPRSTVFFANVPVSLGWQAGDGPLLRWAYRDSTLHSYFLTQFSRAHAERGPIYFFAVENGSLRDKTLDRAVLPSFAYSMFLAERPLAAVDALEMAQSRDPNNKMLRYWLAWAHWATADTAAAATDLRSAGMNAARASGSPPRSATELGSRADTLRRVAELSAYRDEVALDPWVHARLAAICLALPERRQEGVIEAYAFRLLAPNDPDAWRKWASAQLGEEQYEPALRSLERYLTLTGEAGHQDREARRVVESLRSVVQGEAAQRGLRSF